MSVDWHCLTSQKARSAKTYYPVTEVLEHPLKPLTVTALDNRNSRKLNGASKTSSANTSIISMEPLSLALDGCDPLTLFAKQDAIMDPLSKIVDEIDSAPKITTAKPTSDTMLGSSAALWASRRSAILSKFTTSEKLSIVTSFLTGGEMLKTTQTTIAEKVRHRLEQLDDYDESSVHHMLDLTQQEYVVKIELLNQELVQAWNTDQRVKALKIAIQCAKLLSDTSVMQFYPSQFVLVTDILDNFGRLVFERLRTKAEYFKPGSTVATPLPENFTPDMVPAAAKETCENWFYKIASIRELLPRLYVEIAILRSYSFLTQSEFSQALMRLTHIIRGIGDPLVATYVRCYLCRVGMTVNVADRTYIKSNLNDYLFIYHTMFAGGIKSEVARQRFDMTGYLTLYQPALDWIMQALAAQGSDVLLDDIIKQCQDKKNNGLLLNSIIASYRPPAIAARALLFVNIISNSTTEGITKAQLFRTLGICLNQCAPPADQKLPVFNGAWKTINTLTHNGEYMSCAEPWAAFTSQHFGLHETNTMMGEVLVRMNQNRAFESHYAELQSMADKIITHSKHFEGLLILDNFLPFIDLFQKDSVRQEVCKQVMLACRANSDGSVINDPVISNALMYICKHLSDSVNELTVDDERRLISQLISSFIRRADYGRDVEKQLTFYVDARATFPNLDSVFVTLVHCVNRLAMETRRLVNGLHNRKTAAFVKACAAYCYITIPSIASVTTRMDLYLLSGQVALQNQCLGQADACFEATLQLVLELPKTIDCDGTSKSSEPYLVSFLANFLSTLIVVPDSPEQGVLYLVRKLLDLVERISWNANGSGAAQVYLSALDMLTVAAHDVYPYHIAGVISNDELYGSDPKFLGEIDSLCSRIGEQLLVQLKVLGDAQQMRSQAMLAVDVFLKIVFNADVSREKMFALAGNLWSLAMKNRSSLDAKYPGKILLKVDRLKGQTVDPTRRHALEELTTKMKTRM